MALQSLNEYPWCPYPCFRNSVRGDDGRYRIRGLEDKLPMLFSILAVKPENQPVYFSAGLALPETSSEDPAR